jgi:hypothetical protein
MYFCSGQPMHFCSGVDSFSLFSPTFKAFGGRGRLGPVKQLRAYFVTMIMLLPFYALASRGTMKGLELVAPAWFLAITGPFIFLGARRQLRDHLSEMNHTAQVHFLTQGQFGLNLLGNLLGGFLGAACFVAIDAGLKLLAA